MKVTELYDTVELEIKFKVLAAFENLGAVDDSVRRVTSRWTLSTHFGYTGRIFRKSFRGVVDGITECA
jgi:hypothetical protein